MRPASILRSFTRGWLISFAVFGVLAIFVVGQFALAVSMPLSEALRMAGRDWLPWAVFTPPLFHLCAWMPLTRERWKAAVPIHIVCGLATITLSNLWAESVLPPQFPLGPPPPESGASKKMLFKRGSEPPPPAPKVILHRPFRSVFLIGFRLPIYLAIIGAAHAAHFYRRSQERERRTLELEASLARARLETLKMQLQPHFLFNSLNAIAELVHHDSNAADDMLTALSGLLRLTLDTSSEQQLPLRRELEIVEKYLAIERVRFGDRLKVRLDISPDVYNAQVPTLLLQPLVENAIHHGLEPKTGQGALTIRATRDGNTLKLEVSDNGAGLPQGLPTKEGIGLTNTRARLQELYGQDATLELYGRDGLTVDIHLPYRLAP